MISQVILFAELLFLASSVFDVVAQTLVNGQVFTNGLAIIDAPAPNGTQNAGSNMPIAIEIGGNGKLPLNASIPGANNNSQTHYDSLTIFLTSISHANPVNLTISNSTSLLTQETGSTVKHLDFPLSTCLPSGNYNVTFYEYSHINGTAYFSITPIPIAIHSANSSSSTSNTCINGTNTVQNTTQASAPPAVNPFISGNASVITFPQGGTSSASTLLPVLIVSAILYINLFGLSLRRL